MNKVIVTGATSMIGAELLDFLVKDDNIEKIYAVIRPGTTKTDRISASHKIKLIDCDIQDYRHLVSLIQDSCAVFYHLAWSRTDTYNESMEDILIKTLNLQATVYAAKAAAMLGCRSFIGAGGQSEYGIKNTDKISPEDVCDPIRADGILKYAAYKLSQILCDMGGVDCIWMRIFSAYGIYDRMNSMIMSTIEKLMAGERCSFTPAEQEWDYCHSTDIARAFYLAGKVSGSHIYCVGSGKPKKLKEYIQVMRDIVNPGAELGIGELPYPHNPVMRLCADISTLERDTGWKPTITFEEGVSQIFEYLRTRRRK